MECCTESSIFRVESQSKTDWVAAKKNNDPVVALMLLSRSHTFFGKTASSREQQKVVSEVYNFVWKSPETLPTFKKRWEDLAKRVANMGITDGQLPKKILMLSFANALCSYGHSTAVQNECIFVVAHIDGALETQRYADYNIDLLYEELVRLAEAQHHTVDATPRLKDPTALAAVSTISGKLKKEGQQKAKDSKVTLAPIARKSQNNHTSQRKAKGKTMVEK